MFTESKLIASQFSKVFNGYPNALTPYVDGYAVRGDYALELSHGSGFNHETFYGVTVIDVSDQEPRRTRLSQGGFKTRRQAEEYAEGIHVHD